MNIGILIAINEENESIWTNGIKQNAIYLLKTLNMLGHNVYLVNTTSTVTAPYDDKVVWDVNEFPVMDWTNAYKESDILFFLGSIIPDGYIDLFKSLGENRKAIKYVCGNTYIMDAESSIFELTGEGRRYPNKIQYYNQNFDEVWILPHHWNTNSEYLRVLHNLPKDKVKVVPFIWDPHFLDIETEKYLGLESSELPIYVPGKDINEKKITSFEPNINIVKWSMIPTLMVEDYFNDGGEFNKFTILSGDSLITQKFYQTILENTKLYNNDPIKINWLPRIPVTHALSKITDVIVSHQWENALNFSYLDVLYLQYPLVHNSPYLKDAGYYYEGFNIAEGKKQLKLAMNNHDANLDDYNAKSEEVLTRYTIYNDEMIELYGKLLDNVIEPNTHELSYDYNWETNTYH